MNSEEKKQFAIGKWILATFGGWFLGVILIMMLSGFLDSIGIEGMQFYLGLGMGAGVGLAQWLIFRKFSEMSPLWILFSALGMGIPFIILDLIPIGTVSYKLALSVAFSALVVGLLQFLLLKKHSPKAYLWIFGSFIGWTLGVAIVFIINYTMLIKVTGYMNLVMALVNLLLILAGGIVLGVISGITLKKIID
ncbi:MAG: hypothetical protein AAB336_10365 [Acidobacteriota bacterium]